MYIFLNELAEINSIHIHPINFYDKSINFQMFNMILFVDLTVTCIHVYYRFVKMGKCGSKAKKMDANDVPCKLILCK